MKFSPVIVCDHEDAVRCLPDLSKKVGFQLEKADLALIKPNICGFYPPSLGLLSSLVEFLLHYVEAVVIGETRSMMHDPGTQFRSLGVNDLLERFNGQLRALDLSEDKKAKVRVSNPHVLKEIELPKTVLDSDFIVNFPKVGTHSTTRLTSALKNLFGLLPQKHKYSVYHPLGMDEVLADIAQVITPDLNIVEAGNRVCISRDALAVDVVACRFVNLDPLKVEHLVMVSEDRGERLEIFMKKLKVTSL
jgi:uncharacterized protein (DUF362 family)